jgi:hypothetical protein
MAGLKAEETRKRNLAADLDGVAALDGRQIKAELVERAADVRAVLGRRGPETRRLIREVIQERVPCEPFREDGEVGYRFAVRASFGALLTGSTNDGVPDGTGPIYSRVPWSPGCLAGDLMA